MRETRYLSHAWALLTKDRGWYTLVLALSVCMLVPVVGWLVVLGYEMEWARLVAWGFEGPPQKRDIDISRCLQSGCRAFVAVLGWCVVWVALYCIVAMAVARSYFGPYMDALDAWTFVRMMPWVMLSVWNPVSWPFLIAASFCVVLTVMVGVRATIYQNYAAGYQVGRIVEMIRRDAGGYAKVSGLVVLIGLVGEFVLLTPARIIIAAAVFAVFADGAFFALFLRLALCLLIAVYYIVVSLMTHTMVGLWMRQFEVSSWGKSEDSLPAGWRPGPDARSGSVGEWDRHAEQPYQFGQSQFQEQWSRDQQWPQDQPQTQGTSSASDVTSGACPPDVGWVPPAPTEFSRADQADIPFSPSADGGDIRPFPDASAPGYRPSPVDSISPISRTVETLASQPPQPAGPHAASQSPQSADDQAPLGTEASEDGVRPNEDQ